MVQQTGQLIFGCLFVCPFDSYTKIHQHHHVNNNKSRDNREKKLVALELSIHSMHACLCVCVCVCSLVIIISNFSRKKTFFLSQCPLVYLGHEFFLFKFQHPVLQIKREKMMMMKTFLFTDDRIYRAKKQTQTFKHTHTHTPGISNIE